jgi:hypothetical protein
MDVLRYFSSNKINVFSSRYFQFKFNTVGSLPSPVILSLLKHFYPLAFPVIPTKHIFSILILLIAITIPSEVKDVVDFTS